MARLDGKVTIITGAASGLGRVAALKFAAEGSRVVVADITDGTDTVSTVAQTGGTAAYIKLDVTSEECCIYSLNIWLC